MYLHIPSFHGHGFFAGMLEKIEEKSRKKTLIR
jgi:hypothetical protein